MITETQLETVGLSSEEASVYHALLHCGPMGLQALARNTGLKRTTLYPYVERLAERNMVITGMNGKRTVYSAGNPERLLLQLNEQRHLLEALLPQILPLLSASGSQQNILVYSSVEELKAGIKNIVLSGSATNELLTIEGDLSNMFRFGLSFWKELLSQKEKMNVHSRSLIADDEKKEFIMHEHPIELRVTSMLRGFQICLYVLRDQALLFVPSQGIGIHFSNKAVASSLALMFEGIWRQGKLASFDSIH